MKKRLACFLIDLFAHVYVLFNPVTPVATSRITDTVCGVKTGHVNFYLYQENGVAFCIDTGFGKSVIKRELDKLGIPPDTVTHVLLTHTDFDHAGGVACFEKARVYVSRDEAVMVDGTRARQLGLIYNTLPRKHYTLLHDNQLLHIGNTTVRAIATPGHTPGSMSYLVDDRYLFTGDAFRIIGGRVRPIRAILTMDMAAQIRSIQKLAQLPEVQMVFTAHRGFTRRYREIMADYTQRT